MFYLYRFTASETWDLCRKSTPFVVCLLFCISTYIYAVLIRILFYCFFAMTAAAGVCMCVRVYVCLSAHACVCVLLSEIMYSARAMYFRVSIAYRNIDWPGSYPHSLLPHLMCLRLLFVAVYMFAQAIVCSFVWNPLFGKSDVFSWIDSWSKYRLAFYLNNWNAIANELFYASCRCVRFIKFKHFLLILNIYI